MIIAPVEMAGIREELIDVADGHPKLRVEDEVDAAEVGRGDADDGVRMAGERDGLAQDTGIGIETRFPNAVAEDNDRRVLFVVAESAAQRGSELRNVEEIRGGGLAPETLRIALAGDGGGEKFIKAGNAGEGFGVVADVGVER